MVNTALARVGLSLVRLPPKQVPPRMESDADVADPARFFPVGEHKPWTLPPELLEADTPWARQLRELYAHPFGWPGSIVPEGGMLLQLLIRNIRPKVIVETGTFLGVSTIWLASALRAIGGGSLHTYDLFRAFDEWTEEEKAAYTPMRPHVERHLSAAGLADLVILHEGDTRVTIAESRDELRAAGGVQFAFLDGDHSAEGVLADLRALEPVLQVGGFVLLHDTFPEVCSREGPRWLLDHLDTVSSARYQVVDLYLAQLNYGLAVLRRIG